ncbi:hypothetical protein KEM48_000826 [Puccinia striiformis f. sp. tritici PST-130]|nr:hypothetical protein KEM48_000826 [Puccinia striiformis f. sp. tritici PST-130]
MLCMNFGWGKKICKTAEDGEEDDEVEDDRLESLNRSEEVTRLDENINGKLSLRLLQLRSRASPTTQASKLIDKTLKDDEKQMTKEVKILLLGAGESGKTTVLKQMQIVHNRGGFTSSQKEHYRQQVFMNICEGMRLCLEVMSKEEIELENADLMRFVPMFNQYVDVEPRQPFPIEYLEPLSLYWVDGGIRKAMDSGNEWALPENFFPELDRLFHPSYVPSDLDILHCRGKTTGITETVFNVSELTYRMFDVGGQRSERKKWIHCFEGVTAVLFLVAISGYDARLLEDGDANQMQEALMLFDTITNSQWFLRLL